MRTNKQVVRIRPGSTVMTRQQLPYGIGVSDRTAGSSGLCMHRAMIPPGAASDAHSHVGHETAIYIVSGSVRTHYGPGLRESIDTEPGDFLYIAAGVPHRAVNLSPTEPALAIVARNVADEQESVVPYDQDE